MRITVIAGATFLSLLRLAISSNPIYLPAAAKFCASTPKFCPAEVYSAAKEEVVFKIGGEEMLELEENVLELKNDKLISIETAKWELYMPLNATTIIQAAEMYPDRTVIKNILQPRDGVVFTNTVGTTSNNCSAVGVVGVLGLVNNVLSYCASDMTWTRVV